MMFKTTKQIRNTLKDNDWGFDVWVEYDKKVWVGLDELRKEIERMSKIAPKSKNNQLELSFYIAGMDTAYNNVLSLCNSQEQNIDASNSGTQSVSSVSCEHNTGEGDVSETSRARTLRVSQSPTSSPVQNPKRCKCKIRRTGNSACRETIICVRCGGEL